MTRIQVLQTKTFCRKSHLLTIPIVSQCLNWIALDLKKEFRCAMNVADVFHPFGTSGGGFAAKPCSGELCIECNDVMELDAAAAADVTLAGGNMTWDKCNMLNVVDLNDIKNSEVKIILKIYRYDDSVPLEWSHFW